MARVVKDAKLDNRENRLKLSKRKEPYWKSISEGIHLGYYRSGRGSGMWHARIRTLDGKRYVKSTLGDADDHCDADGVKTLTFSQAQELARLFAEKIFRDDESISEPCTVTLAVTEYLADFKAQGKKSLYSTETQINAHILPTFGDRL